jgi:hypothetical protein
VNYRLLGAALLLLAPLSSLAETPAAPPATPAPMLADLSRDPFSDAGSRPRFHANVDYLLWFLKPNHLGTPVLTGLRDQTEDVASTFAAGGLADPNAVVLFGGRNIDRGPYSGMSVSFRYDLDDDGRWGAELGGFWLPRQGNTYHFASNANGIPALVLPFFDPTSSLGGTGETGGTFAAHDFGGSTLIGHVDIRTATQLWGADANLALEIFRNDKWRVEALGGFRYLALEDLFQETAVVSNGFDGKTYDRFATANNFYGGQLGLRLAADYGWIRPELTTKVALGWTQETLDISGSAVLPGNAIVAPGAHQLPGGFYTALSNIGSSTTNRFAVVSETNLSLAFRLSQALSVRAGYSFLYWSNVMRSGDQVNRTLNSQLNPAFTTFIPGPISGPLQPARPNKETDFWGHGFNLGVELRF